MKRVFLVIAILFYSSLTWCQVTPTVHCNQPNCGVNYVHYNNEYDTLSYTIVASPGSTFILNSVVSNLNFFGIPILSVDTISSFAYSYIDTLTPSSVPIDSYTVNIPLDFSEAKFVAGDNIVIVWPSINGNLYPTPILVQVKVLDFWSIAEDKTQNWQVNLYNGNLKLIHENLECRHLRIYNSSGMLVYKNHGNEAQINNLSNGLYILEFIDSKGLKLSMSLSVIR